MSAKGLLAWLPAVVSQNDYTESIRRDDTNLALHFQAELKTLPQKVNYQFSR